MATKQILALYAAYILTNFDFHLMTLKTSRKRASHSVVTGHQQEEQPLYRDVYSHPAALEYAAAHPRRTIPKFGPYLLLQTLGEGEFGKVKLGLHMQWGEEVAVKLIRRGNIDSSVRMSKVEREIEVLRVRVFLVVIFTRTFVTVDTRPSNTPTSSVSTT